MLQLLEIVMGTALTSAQVAAIENWKVASADRIFTGTSAELLAQDFIRANSLKEKDPESAAKIEQALFAICGIETSVTK